MMDRGPAYRVLLRLLPRRRRERYGAEMAAVFAEVRAQARRERGLAGVAVAWMKEMRDVVRSGIRQRLGRQTSAPGNPRRLWPGRGPGLLAEIQWAWRGVRSRGARAVLIVGLLAVALAANTVLFSVADSLVFTRLPYAEPHRLVLFSAGRAFWHMSPEQLDEWRDRSDLFVSVHGYLGGRVTFVEGATRPTRLTTAFVTPGLVEMLGWAPRWGRSLGPGDELDVRSRTVLVGERFARAHFGDPERAVGATLRTADVSLHVVGVMPYGFAFPDQQHQIWRPLDYERVAESGVTGFQAIARLAPEITTGAVNDWLQATVATPSGEAVGTGTLDSRMPDGGAPLMLTLVGAAFCLLLTACASIGSLELAGALGRARVFAIQHALGASRQSLVSAAAIEAGVLVGAAALAGYGLGWLGIGVVRDWLTEGPARWAANPIDIDGRSIAFMVAIAAASWLVTTIPVAWFGSRRDVSGLLQQGARTAAGSRIGVLVWRGLAVAEIALAVILLSGGVLFTRTYAALTSLDKGFDASGLARVSLTWPANATSTAAVAEVVHDRLAQLSYVAGVTRSSALEYQMLTRGRIESDDSRTLGSETALSIRTVDAAFLGTLGFRMAAGRGFHEGEPPEHVVITDRLASALWPAGSAVGQRFRTALDAPWLTVIGVVASPRDTSDRPDGRVFDYFIVYVPAQPRTASPTQTRRSTPPAPQPVLPNVPTRGATYRFNTFLVRLDDLGYLDELTAVVRAIDARFDLNVEALDAVYARQYADRLLASRVVGGFGALAFAVALAGVFGLMAYVTSSRVREIGIRMALGAARGDIRRMVLGSSIALAVTGVALGLAGAIAASRVIDAQLYGVSPTDPATYGGVIIVVLVTAVAATWSPTRRAARVDPAVTLRSE